MADPNGTSRPKDIVRELGRVDESFSMLKPGREIDDAIGALLDADPVTLPGLAPRRPGRALAALAAVLVVAAAAFLLVPRDAGGIAVAPPPPPAPARVPALAPAPMPMPARETVPLPAPERVAVQEGAVEHKRVVDVRPPAANATRLSVLEPDEIRFVDVPFGTLEVRAPAVVDVSDDGAEVVMGAARLLKKGKPARTLVAGETIAWKVAAPPRPGVSDDEVQRVLEEARALQARGNPAAAADLLGDLLARRPSPRVADTVTFERGQLLARARNITDACATWAEHARRFPKSENAADVVSARERLGCR